MKKAVVKALKNLTAMKNVFTGFFLRKDNESFTMLSILKEAESVTVNSLEYLLLFITGSKGLLMERKWSQISKLLQYQMSSKRLTQCCSFLSVQSLHQLRIFNFICRI
jgi:hypothetical protein